MDPFELVDPVLLRSFIAVSETRSFTAAARRLGLRQSAVSQHVARLERRLGRRLFSRDTHAVRSTPEGDAVLILAREVYDVAVRIERYLSGSELRGRIRFGASDDFVTTALPDVLAEFKRQHSAVDLELTVSRSANLCQAYSAGDLDLIFAKRHGEDVRGRLAWTEELRWVGKAGMTFGAEAVPLVLFPPPSISRSMAITALESAGRAWRVACTSDSLSGLRAAALAGLGVAPHSARLIPQGLSVLGQSSGLPVLGTFDFVVVGGTTPGTATHALAATLLSSTDRIAQAPERS